MPHAPPGGTPSHVKVKISFKVAVPSVGRTLHRHRHARLGSRLKRVWSMADNTAGIQVIAYAAGDRTTQLGTTVADISQSSSNCSPIPYGSGSYGGRSCTFSLQAVPGTDDFVVTTYDNVSCSGGTCTIPSGAKQLGYGVTPSVTITAGAPPAGPVSLSIEGVLAKLAIAVSPNVIHTIVPSKSVVDVYGMDADGDVIVSNGYIDGNGAPITIGLSANNTLPLAGSSAASLTFSPASIATPRPAGVTLNYAPPANGIVAASSQTVTVTASPSASTVAAATATLTAVPPSYTLISDPNLNAANAYHGGMAVANGYGYVGNVYYSTAGGLGGISYYNGSGTSITDNYAVPSSPALTGGVADNGGGTYYAITGTTMDQFSTPPSSSFGPVPNSFGAPASNGSALAYDATRTAIAYASSTNLIEYNPSGGSPASYAIGTTTKGGIAIDSGDVLWIVDTVTNKLIKEDTVNPASSFSLQAGGSAFDVLDQTNAASTKESLFVTDRGANPAILELDTTGSLLNTLAAPAGALPSYLARDASQPGIVWFDYITGSKIGLGRLDMNGATPKFLMATGPAGTATSGSVQAGAIGASAGQVYTVFDNAQKLVQWNP